MSGVRVPITGDRARRDRRYAQALASLEPLFTRLVNAYIFGTGEEPRAFAVAYLRGVVQRQQQASATDDAEDAGTLESFVASLDVPAAVAAALRKGAAAAAAGNVAFAQSFADRGAIAEQLRDGGLVDDVAAELWAGIEKLRTQQGTTAAELNLR